MAHLSKLAEQYPDATSLALKRTFEAILTESKKICPVKTSYLRGSGYVSDPVIGYGQILLTIGYSAEYAYWVHELIDNYHRPPTRAKFLEEPLQLYSPNIVQAVKEEVDRIIISAGV